jgi:hypothetical protein
VSETLIIPQGPVELLMFQKQSWRIINVQTQSWGIINVQTQSWGIINVSDTVLGNYYPLANKVAHFIYLYKLFSYVTKIFFVKPNLVNLLFLDRPPPRL